MQNTSITTQSVSVLSAFMMLALLLVSGVASATDDEPHFMVGEKYGRLQFNSNVNDVYDNTHGNGFLLGYDFGNQLALQAELLRANGNLSSLAANGTYDARSEALYLAYRSPGDLYYLVKGGYLWEHLDMNSSGATSSNRKNGFSAGLGAGYRFGLISLEAEYTRIDKNLNTATLGFNFNF